MSSSDRSRELIHKYLEDLVSRSEIVELEVMLSTDPEVAGAFAEAARLDGMLKGHFRKQHKIDQVAALLHAAEASPTTGDRLPEATRTGAGQPGALAETPRLTGTTFVRRLSEPTRPRRSPIAVTVGGREAERVPAGFPFEVAGKDGAVLQGPRGIRLELTPATRAFLRQASDGIVIRLNSGGADITVPRGRAGLRIETELGIVTGADCRFSLELGMTLPAPATATQKIQAPVLIVVVARGSVIVERDGVSTTLSAGERQAFL